MSLNFWNPTSRSHRWVLTAAAAISLAACGAEDASTEASATEAANDAKTQGVADGKADRWTSADDPKLFDTELEYRVAELPTDGEAARIPWAANYWPVYQDSINHKWDGAQSVPASVKYEQAFGVSGVADAVSKHNGVEKYESRTACTEDSECNDKIGERCAKRDGAEGGFCIPTWWGICHAWAPVSIMEPEPVHPVTVNGVTFKVNDIKGLLTLAHDKVSSRFVSLRCNEDEEAGDIEYDGYGRPTGDDTECADTNPGTLHVLLANYLGLKGESFVMDRTFDDEVWNQPLSGYETTRFETVSAQRANQLVGVLPEGDEHVKRHEATLAKEEWTHQDAVAVTAGKTIVVTMTGDGDADLYVAFDAQPTTSNYACRPYAGNSAETCELTVPEGAKELFVSAVGYAEKSVVNITTVLDPLAGISEKYLFNQDAVTLYHVELDLHFIVESAASTDGNLADNIQRYTHTDHLEYILEVDADGKVIGGEWLGASKKAHPDFLWLPTGRRDHPIAGGTISYSHVKALLDKSIAGPGGTLDFVTLRETATVPRGEWAHFGPFAADDAEFTAVMSGTGDGDLYVRRGAAPTAGEYDCRPYKGGSAESCSLSGAGDYYVAVYGYSAAEVEVAVTYQGAAQQPVEEPTDGEPTDGEPTDGEPADGEPTDGEPSEPVVVHLDASGELAEDGMDFYTVNVEAGRRVVVRTTAPGDIDVYVKLNMAPTTYNYDARAYTASGDETVTFVPTADGVLHIGVHGYEASSYTLNSADN